MALSFDFGNTWLLCDHLLLPHRGGDFNFRAQLPENTRATLTSGSLATSSGWRHIFLGIFVKRYIMVFSN